jgi:hypothetical protein
MVKLRCVRSYLLLLTALLFCLISFSGFISAFIDNGSRVQYIGLDMVNPNLLFGSAVLNTTGATYFLTNDTISTGSVTLNITANNITVDGQGFIVAAAGYDKRGISANRISFITVKDVTFQDFNLYNFVGSRAVFLSYVNYSNFSNVGFVNNERALILEDSSYNSFRLLNFSQDGYGIYATYANNNTFDSCIFSDDGSFLLSDNNTIINSDFYVSQFSMWDADYNIFNNNLLTGSIFSLRGSYADSNHNDIKNNILEGSAIYLGEGGSYNFFENNTIRNSGFAGVEVAN